MGIGVGCSVWWGGDSLGRFMGCGWVVGGESGFCGEGWGSRGVVFWEIEGLGRLELIFRCCG